MIPSDKLCLSYKQTFFGLQLLTVTIYHAMKVKSLFVGLSIIISWFFPCFSFIKPFSTSHLSYNILSIKEITIGLMVYWVLDLLSFPQLEDRENMLWVEFLVLYCVVRQLCTVRQISIIFSIIYETQFTQFHLEPAQFRMLLLCCVLFYFIIRRMKYLHETNNIW